MGSRRPAVALTAGLGAYALAEPYLFRVAEHEVPVAPGAPLAVLHISDTHMGPARRPRYRRLATFLRALPRRVGPVDLVLLTGDLIEGDEGIGPLLDALAPIDARLGRYYVLGSHDYFLSNFRLYTKYLTGARPVRAPRADTERLEQGLKERGFTSLSNSTELLDTDAGPVRLAGVDDPYLGWHDTAHIRRAASDVLAIGLVHSPDVVSEWALAGFDVVVAGHTHAGQVRLPGLGALVTNCSLPAALAGGLHRVGDCFLHVSPGLGNGRFAPIRFLCRPEATLLRLVPT